MLVSSWHSPLCFCGPFGALFFCAPPKLEAHAGAPMTALFSAMAQVPAHVNQLRAAMAGRGAVPGDLPELRVPAELDPHTK
jgi:hypothetical protein